MKDNGKTATGAMCLDVDIGDWKGHFSQSSTDQQVVRDQADRTAKLWGRDGFVVQKPVRPIGGPGSNP